MSALAPITANSEEAKLAAQRWSDMKTDRAQHESMWEDIARLMRPQRGGFSSATPADRT